MKALDDLGAAFLRASDTYAARNAIPRNDEWYVLKLGEELGELTQAWMKLTGRGRPGGRSEEELRRAVSDETADLLGHVLLFAVQNGVELSQAIKRKWLFDPEGL